MYPNLNIRRFIIQTVSLLYVLLFVYASMSKLFDFERFQIQLAQSPILSAYAFWISWLVITIELLTSALLIYSRTRLAGLFSSLSLMTMFTVYIYIVLHYSSFVPCSCGGILEKMTWNIHLIFNIFFIFLALTAIIMSLVTDYKSGEKKRIVKYIYGILFSIFGSATIVTVLFISSENIVHHKNPFIRRYPKDVISFIRNIDLSVNSYYFAGSENNTIYLANFTDPLHLLAVDSLGNKNKIKLSFNPKNTPFRSLKIVIRNQYVYLMDGTVPCIFRGSTRDWNLKDSLPGLPGFTAAQPIDSSTFIVRIIDGKKMSTTLGIYAENQMPKLKYVHNLLEKQKDGIFDTDGMLLYDEELKLGLYTYFYRNHFIGFDQDGNKRISGNTIDTTSTAKIKVADLKNGAERQMAAPPLKVNSKTATRSNLLFVISRVPGQFEDENMWKKSSVIDVYNLQEKSYVLSLYIQEEPGQRTYDFFITKTHLYVLSGIKLRIYSLGKLLQKEMETISVKP